MSGTASALPPTDLTPITDAENLTGNVATDVPGTPVGSGAEITSAVEPDDHSVEYYAVSLLQGQHLVVHTDQSCCSLSSSIATPNQLAAANDDWSGWQDDPARGGTGDWPVAVAGVYSVRVQDNDGSGSAVRPYTISFSIVAAP